MLIRHGQSTWNSEHRIQGQLDPPLSAEGRRQAELLAGRLAGRRFAGFYSSDLKRAFETAEILAPAVGARPEPVPALREIFLGEWEGLRTEEIAERFPEAWDRWVEEPDWDVVPGGEGAAHFDARVGGAIDDILERRGRGDHLVTRLAIALRVEQVPEQEVQRSGFAVPTVDDEGPGGPLTLSGFENRSKGSLGQRAVRLQQSSPEVGGGPTGN